MPSPADAAPAPGSAEQVVRSYFAALAARDADAMAACWAPHGEEHIHGLVDTTGPDGVRAYFEELFGALPDFALEPHQWVVDEPRVAVHWHATGTFTGPGRFQGLEPNGTRLKLEGVDVLRVEDGLIVRNDAYANAALVAQQLGAAPPTGSRAEQLLLGAVNVAGRGVRALDPAPRPIADGVWLLRGGVPRAINAFLVEEEGGGVCLVDTGIRAMARPLARAAAERGGITRVVLTHAHPDHRGAAALLHAPVFTTEADRDAAEGDAYRSQARFEHMAKPVGAVYPHLIASWDAGPVPVAGTVAEGDDVAGFTVVPAPGHSPGQIALFRERDGLLLAGDAFVTIDIQTTRPRPASLPHPAFTPDLDAARASLRRLADLEPREAWPGHVEPATGDVAGQLRRAADVG